MWGGREDEVKFLPSTEGDFITVIMIMVLLSQKACIQYMYGVESDLNVPWKEQLGELMTRMTVMTIDVLQRRWREQNEKEQGGVTPESQH